MTALPCISAQQIPRNRTTCLRALATQLRTIRKHKSNSRNLSSSALPFFRQGSGSWEPGRKSSGQMRRRRILSPAVTGKVMENDAWRRGMASPTRWERTDTLHYLMPCAMCQCAARRSVETLNATFTDEAAPIPVIARERVLPCFHYKQHLGKVARIHLCNSRRLGPLDVNLLLQ